MDRILEILSQLQINLFSATPRVLGALIIFIVGWIVAKFAAMIVRRILKSLGVDKLAEKLNEIDFIEKSSFDVIPSQVLSKITYYFLLLFIFNHILRVSCDRCHHGISQRYFIFYPKAYYRFTY